MFSDSAGWLSVDTTRTVTQKFLCVSRKITVKLISQTQSHSVLYVKVALYIETKSQFYILLSVSFKLRLKTLKEDKRMSVSSPQTHLPAKVCVSAYLSHISSSIS